MPADRLNLTGELQGQLSMVPEEHSDDRAARLRTEARRELLRDVTDFLVFVVLIAAIVAVGWIAAYESVWNAGATPETRRWSQTVLSAVMAGGICFVAGRKIGSR